MTMKAGGLILCPFTIRLIRQAAGFTGLVIYAALSELRGFNPKSITPTVPK